MKRILAMVISVALVATMAITGSVAYLQAEDGAVNTMVMGNVDIEQLEYERVVEDGAWVSTGETDKYGYTPDKIQPFTNGTKPLYPAVFADGDIKWDDRNGSQATSGEGSHQQSWDQVGASGSSPLFDDSVKNVVDKFVFVKNTGKSDAYVRTWIALEQGSIAADNFHDVIMTNSDLDHWSWEVDDTGVVIDGNTYVVWCATYLGPKSNPTGILAPNTVSYPSLLQVYMTPEATNEDCAAIDGNGNGSYDILVFSQAVQSMGFADAKTALNEAFGEEHPWQGEDVPSIPAVVEDADGLIEALESDKDVIMTDDIKIDPAGMSNAYGTTGINVKNGQTIDGRGNTLDIKGAGGTWDSGINTTGGTIKNLTVTGSFRGIFINHNSEHSERVILENVTTDGTVYTISCDQGSNKGLTATNCTFKGWTSYAATLGDAKFVDCYFGEGSGYAFCRPYAPTEFVDCKFEAGFEMDPRAAVTFENCTLDGVALTADNLATLVTSNIANATVK